jgi:hypothetical protein
MYFSATIFTLMGFASPTLTSLTVAATNFVMTCVALVLIDKVGRRRILLYSIPIMAFGLLLCSGGFVFIDLPDDLNSVNPSSTAGAYEEVPLSQRTAQYTLYGFWHEHEYELGCQFYCWPDILAHDALPDAGLDICYLCNCVYHRLDRDLEDIPRNERTQLRRDRCSAGEWLGSQREPEESERAVEAWNDRILEVE